MPTIGIDLGTTNSRVGVFRNGNFEIIPNSNGGRVTPSIVAFCDDYRLVGEEAMNQMAMNLENTVVNIKRCIGRNVSKSAKGTINEEITATLLVELKKNSEHYLKSQVEHTVITVPASFNDIQRQVVKDAGRIAGFKKVRLLNEPTAAAIAYGADIPDQPDQLKKIMVFTLGGGCLDVTILTIHNRVYHVVATAGDDQLGGLDFDERLVDYCIYDIKRTYNRDIRKYPRDMCQLRSACENAKKRLSFTTETVVIVEELIDGQDYKMKLNLSRFETLCQDLVDKAMKPVEQVLKDAKMDRSEIDDVILVGGSTRIPKLRKLISNYFGGKILSKSVDTDEAVVRGAAIRAGATEDLIVEDVTSYDISYQLNGSDKGTIIERNMSIPIKATKKFEAKLTNLSKMEIKILREDQCIAVLTHKGSSSKAKMESISVDVEIDEDGILGSITAKNIKTNKELVVANCIKGLKENDIRKIVQKLDQSDAKRKLENLIKEVKKGMEGMTATFRLKDERCRKMDVLILWYEKHQKEKMEVYEKKYDELFELFRDGAKPIVEHV